MEQIFISSVQKELQPERYAIRDFVHTNDLLRQFFRVFLFEDLPPADRRPDDIYLDEVARSPIYIGLFGNEYGGEDSQGLSATEKEFNQASTLRKRRLILIKGRSDDARKPKMKILIARVRDDLLRRRFEDTPELLRLLYGSLIQYLQDRGFIAARDFDAAPSEASLNDISKGKLRSFIEKAREERAYPLAPDTPPAKALSHLNLIAKGAPTQGAVLLFGESPDRFVPASEIACLHFHGTEIVKPIPTQQVYHGTLFELVDKAVDFVMSRVARAVKPSATSPQSTVEYEVPYKAVREAIVNAVAHRNYASKSGVQVMVFADRIEVWNPGGLPEDLTPEQLRRPHPSVPRNRLICEPLFLAHYIERAGTGTLDMIRLCTDAGLPEPDFRPEGERFTTVIWRDWLTDKAIADMGLYQRQVNALRVLKLKKYLTNSLYQEAAGTTRKTAARDLDDLVQKGALVRQGARRGVRYVLATKWDKKGTNEPTPIRANETFMGHLGHPVKKSRRPTKPHARSKSGAARRKGRKSK